MLLKGQRAVGSHTALFLLTDGCPNIEPPRGHVPTLMKLKDTSNFSCSINAFGFGYDLDSKLLEELSITGNCGSYAFIPDGSFVGTIFVNAIATVLSTMATNVQVINCFEFVFDLFDGIDSQIVNGSFLFNSFVFMVYQLRIPFIHDGIQLLAVVVKTQSSIWAQFLMDRAKI